MKTLWLAFRPKNAKVLINGEAPPDRDVVDGSVALHGVQGTLFVIELAVEDGAKKSKASERVFLSDQGLVPPLLELDVDTNALKPHATAPNLPAPGSSGPGTSPTSKATGGPGKKPGGFESSMDD